MSHDHLTPPSKGIFIPIGYALLNIVWAKTWIWADQKGNDRTLRFISFHVVQRKDKDDESTLVSLILGPLKVTLGWS